MPQVKTPRMTSEAKEHLGSSHNAKDKMPFSYMDKIILYVRTYTSNCQTTLACCLFFNYGSNYVCTYVAIGILKTTSISNTIALAIHRYKIINIQTAKIILIINNIQNFNYVGIPI